MNSVRKRKGMGVKIILAALVAGAAVWFHSLRDVGRAPELSVKKEGEFTCAAGKGMFFTEVYRPWYLQKYLMPHERIALTDEEKDILARAIDRIERQEIEKYDSVELYGRGMSEREKESYRMAINDILEVGGVTVEQAEIMATKEMFARRDGRMSPPAYKFAFELRHWKSAAGNPHEKQEWAVMMGKQPKYPFVRRDVFEQWEKLCMSQYR